MNLPAQTPKSILMAHSQSFVGMDREVKILSQLMHMFPAEIQQEDAVHPCFTCHSDKQGMEMGWGGAGQEAPVLGPVG